MKSGARATHDKVQMVEVTSDLLERARETGQLFSQTAERLCRLESLLWILQHMAEPTADEANDHYWRCRDTSGICLEEVERVKEQLEKCEIGFSKLQSHVKAQAAGGVQSKWNLRIILHHVQKRQITVSIRLLKNTVKITDRLMIVKR